MNEYIVSAEQEGMRLDVFLTEQMEGSRSYIQSLIKGGHVTVGGKVGKANLRLTPNMVIHVEIPEPESVEVLPEDIPVDYLYEDHDIIIINKPRGMVVHPAVGNYSGTLVNALLHHCKDLSGINGEIRPGIVHRLDKDTSGVMMAAKNDAAHIGLAEQVKAHSAKRTYLALVQGNIVEEKGIIKAPIGRHPKDRMKMAVVFENSKIAAKVEFAAAFAGDVKIQFAANISEFALLNGDLKVEVVKGADFTGNVNLCASLAEDVEGTVLVGKRAVNVMSMA